MVTTALCALAPLALVTGAPALAAGRPSAGVLRPAGGAAERPSAPGPRSARALVREAVYSFGVAGGDGKMRPLDHTVPFRVTGIPGQVVEVATSNSDSYALTSEGAVWAWGAGGLGELGNGSLPRFSGRPVRVRFAPGVEISSLPNPMPYNSGLAIDSKGNLWGWGYNPTHALCLRSGPLATPEELPATGVTMATGAGNHMLFLSRGKVYACGLGEDGELGRGSTSDSATPTPVLGLPRGVVSLVSSWQGSGALLADGSYYDWGYNRQGQMGNGTTTNVLAPVRVALPGRVAKVYQGGSHPGNGQTLALLADGSVWAWGAGSLGQLGDGSTRSSSVPVQVDLPRKLRVSEVCSGGDTSYALSSSGKLWSWGGNMFGQLGDHRSGRPRLIPVTVRVTLAQISATATNVVGLAR